jgi:hypothetical protein
MLRTKPSVNSESSSTSNNGVLDEIRERAEAQELVQWVRSSYNDMKAARNKQELVWAMHLSYFYGKQYNEIIQSSGGKLYTPKAPPHRVRLTLNRIRPVIRTELARVTSQKPTAYAIPASSEDEDLAAAYAAEQIWESVSNSKKVNRVFRQSAFWMLVTGVGFTKIWWNENLKDSSGNQGDVDFANVTPYHLFVPNLRIENLQEQPYVLNVFTMSAERVQSIYGDKIKVQPDASAEQEIVSSFTLNLNAAQDSEKDAVLVYEMFVKPGAHRLLPNGGMLTVINDQLVQFIPQMPYEHGDFPFIKWDHIPTGTFYSSSVIEDIISPQREYNRTRSQLSESRNRMGWPQFAAPKGSVDAKKITNQPGLVVEYQPGLNPPTPIPLQNIPPYIIEELNRNLMDIEDISGQHSVSKGSVPGGVTAATAISYLQEKDDSLLSHTYASIEEGMEDMAAQTLYLVKQFWDDVRTVKVVGTDGIFDVLQLRGADVSTDIRMEGGSALPTSKAARQAFLLDLMKMGIIPPEEGLKMLDMGGVNKLYQNLKVDDSQAQRENIRLKRLSPEDIMRHQQEFQMKAQMGDPVAVDAETGAPMDPPGIIPVNSWDNHTVHVYVHNRFRKSQAFEQLPEPIRIEFERHVNLHLKAIQQAMMQVNGLTGGQPGGNSYTEDVAPAVGGPTPTTSIDSAGVAPPSMEGSQ